MKRKAFNKLLSIWIIALTIPAGAAGLGSGVKVGEISNFQLPEAPGHEGLERKASQSDSEGVGNALINLRTAGDFFECSSDRGIWTELNVQSIPGSSQGLIDVVVAEDGYVYLAYFDDNQPQPGHYCVFVKRSGDGGFTWENPDGGANGFALYNLFMFRPSIAVFQTTPGTYRLTVAVSAPWPYISSPNDIIVCWKAIGSGDDFTAVSVQNDTNENYVAPRLKSVRRPSNPSLKRVLCASYGYSDGRLWCDYSDTNCTSWNGYSAINPATDQVEIWRADFIEDVINNRLYCVWSAAFSSAPGNPDVLTALSVNRGNSWFSDLYRMAPNDWHTCAESDAAIASNPFQNNKTLMLVWTGIEQITSVAKICYTYQYADSIQVGPGDFWDPSPDGFPVHVGEIYQDADYDNTMPAVFEDSRLNGGGYRVAFIDQHQSDSARVRYSECAFTMPPTWLQAEIVSGGSADPAYGSSNALSSGVGFNNTAFPYRRCALWPDFRSGATCDVWAAWSDIAPSPTPTLPVIPSAKPSGLAVLCTLLAAMLIFAERKRRTRIILQFKQADIFRESEATGIQKQPPDPLRSLHKN